MYNIKRKTVDVKKSVKLEAAALKEEVTLLKDEPVEGLVDDDVSQYFVAVGLMEENIENLKTTKNYNEKVSIKSLQDLEQLR